MFQGEVDIDRSQFIIIASIMQSLPLAFESLLILEGNFNFGGGGGGVFFSIKIFFYYLFNI
jgi:hypothetical protein